jgi:hypothetical protein
VSNAPAIWSAVAASFAALSAFLSFLTQRRNLLESVRPEIVLEGWSRSFHGEGEAHHERLRFATIRNVGRGSAFHVNIATLVPPKEPAPTAISENVRLAIVPPSDERVLVEGDILLFWGNIPEHVPGRKYLSTTVTVFYWDSRGMRHQTNYVLLIANTGTPLPNEIAPGVALSSRATKIRPVWMLKLIGKHQKMLRRVRKFRNSHTKSAPP